MHRGISQRRFSDGSIHLLAGGRRWQDEHPQACQTLVDPTIPYREIPDWIRSYWGLPAGWAPLLNRLHADLQQLFDPEDDYHCFQVGQKLGALCYRMPGPLETKASDLLRRAREESLRICELCAGPAEPAAGHTITRCEDHPAGSVVGAYALPPGLS